MDQPCSNSTSTSSSACHCDTCHCGIPCFYGEGEESCRSESVISWQHFPRSTSSRSHCDGSSMEIAPQASLPEIPCEPSVGGEEKKGESSAVSSTEYPITKSIPQLKAEHYLKIRHVHDFFNFLIGHLICAEPDDPIEYLKEIIGRCLNFREGYGEEPLLVSKYHVKSLYNSFDPYGKGSITVDQYEVAMDSIGISKGPTRPNRNPPLDQNGMVTEEFFVGEALRCLRENLRLMVRIPENWEENRLIWQRVMKRRCRKVFTVRERLNGNSSKASSASGEAEEDVCLGTCLCPPKLRHEPEQLFLTS